jgi:hypothetical protein
MLSFFPYLVFSKNNSCYFYLFDLVSPSTGCKAQLFQRLRDWQSESHEHDFAGIGPALLLATSLLCLLLFVSVRWREKGRRKREQLGSAIDYGRSRWIASGQPVVTPFARPATWCHLG